jgi:hypothetical protein
MPPWTTQCFAWGKKLEGVSACVVSLGFFDQGQRKDGFDDLAFPLGIILAARTVGGRKQSCVELAGLIRFGCK